MKQVISRRRGCGAFLFVKKQEVRKLENDTENAKAG